MYESSKLGTAAIIASLQPTIKPKSVLDLLATQIAILSSFYKQIHTYYQTLQERHRANCHLQYLYIHRNKKKFKFENSNIWLEPISIGRNLMGLTKNLINIMEKIFPRIFLNWVQRKQKESNQFQS